MRIAYRPGAYGSAGAVAVSLMLRRLLVPYLAEAPRGCGGSFPPRDDTPAWGEAASPHVVIAVVISSVGGGAHDLRPHDGSSEGGMAVQCALPAAS